MERDVLAFKVSNFQSSIMTMYCSVCHKLWAADFELPTCICDDYWFIDPYVSVAVINLDVYTLSMYYDGELLRNRFWLAQVMPYYAFLMEVSPGWIDFP